MSTRKKYYGKHGCAVAAMLILSVLSIPTLLLVGQQTGNAYASGSSYVYSPYFDATGSNYKDVSSSSALQLTKFSVAAWFKTTQIPTDTAFISTKGGSGSETAGQNMNYGIWLTSTGQVRAGFEDSVGADYYVTSVNKYNDGQWHYAVLTYGGQTVNLFIDANVVASKSTNATPDNTGSQPFRVGANSLSINKYFIGSIDEVRVYNLPLSSTEVSAQYITGSFSTLGQVSYLNFGSTPTTSAYTVTISISSSTITAKDSSGKILASGSNAATVIQSGVNAIRANSYGGTLHINAGTYYIGSLIDLRYLNNVVIEGDSRDTTILKCSVANSKIFQKSSTTQTKNVTIRNLTFDGANISGKLLDMGNIVNLKVDNVVLERHNWDTPGVFLMALQDSIIQNSKMLNPNNVGTAISITGRNVTFQYNEIIRQAARGPGLGSGYLEDSKIINNYFHDFKGYSAITLENHELLPDGINSFKNIEIAYNTFENLDGNAIRTNGYSGSDGTFYNLDIHHNKVTNAVGHGVMLNAFDSQPNVVTYNSKIHDNTLLNTAGMNLGPSKSCQIDNNVIDHTADWRGYGIYLYKGSDDVTMSGNKISNTEQAAYYYSGSTNIYINGAKVA
jgi:hypothetical protein